MDISDEAAALAAERGIDAIAHLQEQIIVALAARDDVEAVRQDHLLQQVEAVLGTDAYPEIPRIDCQVYLFPTGETEALTE